MDESKAAVLAVVVTTLRQCIAEEWIADFPIDRSTRFNQDLELESIEFVKVAEALTRHYGTGLGLAAWLSARPLAELIHLSVGDLVDYIADVLVVEA